MKVYILVYHEVEESYDDDEVDQELNGIEVLCYHHGKPCVSLDREGLSEANEYLQELYPKVKYEILEVDAE